MIRFILPFLLCTGLLIAADEPKPLREDFESAQVGTLPKGWSVAQTGTGTGSEWKIVEDKNAPKGTKVLAQTGKSPIATFNMCVLDASSFKDVEVSVGFRAVEGEKDQGGGVVWRYKDAKNYYTARFNPLEDNFRVYKIVDGKRMQLGSKAELQPEIGKWHTLSITMQGDAITCSFNGKKHLEVKDGTFAEAGKVGLWTKADAQTYFDDFQANALK